ncbi:hypothetical protein BDN72DRAFT_873456 [Pluteus cervinus]|uniref:Uncharacterized protein n=1 Tax=Pluteus cervinus TaxID=181527 RepID=A0ACD3BGW1_9AGAR|nr:hypothetical protein BDN72DRAFT_873456 [Pluteus cervinus]
MLAATNERHDPKIHDTLMASPNRTAKAAPAYHSTGLLWLFLSFALYPVEAKPTTLLPRGEQHNLQKRQANGDSPSFGSIPTQVWVPILVVALIVLCVAIVVWSKRSLRGNLNLSLGRQPAANQSSVRVVTAEQLAGGSVGRSNGGTDSANSATRRARRPRRPRRTPSQISTTSLPAYNKEPGDEELVIYRGPQDMEDADMPLTTIGGADEEEEEEEEMPTHVRSDFHYSEYPQNSNIDSLMQNDDSAANISSDLLQLPSPPGQGMPRRSVETLQDSEDSGSLMRATSAPDSVNPPMGEAPPYFEVVGTNSLSNHLQRDNTTAQATTTSSPPPPEPPASPEPSRRQSTFRNLFGGGRPTTSTHTRGPSATSALSTHTRDSSHPRGTHRPQSSSGSVLSLTPFRTASHQKSSGTLNSNLFNSPSTISLNSISAPLSHTLVRSEFTYPKAGLTPEQVKLISSRDSFVRFGVPYGADAIAYASASRLDLQQPPPAFEDPNGASGSYRPRADSGAISEGSQPSIDAAPIPVTNGQSNTDSPPAPHTTPTQHTPVASSSSPIRSPEDILEPLPPPPAFKAQPSNLRSESRISSYSSQSFATAAESAPSPTHGAFEISIRPSSPPTPGGLHAVELTDVTITPARSNA